MRKNNRKIFVALTDEILQLPGLNFFDKILLAKINSLDNSKKNCYANNRYFATLLGVSTTYVSRSISKLKRLGYVFIFINRSKGNKRQIKSLLNDSKSMTDTFVQDPLSSSFKHKKENNKELRKEVTAFDFLKTNYPGQMDEWLTKFRTRLINFDKFVLDYNDTVEIEGLQIEGNKLFPRLNKYARNWIINQDKFNNNAPMGIGPRKRIIHED